MSTTTLNSAPPAEAPKGGVDYIRLPSFPKSDTYVTTVVGYNYIPAHPFKRKDETTGAEFIKEAPAIELFIGAEVDGKASLAKTWPQVYSLNERANYQKWYTAAVGKEAAAGSKPDDMVGKALLVEIEVEEKTSKKGTKYTVNRIGAVTKVPSILTATATPVAKLQPALAAALAGDKEGGGGPF